MSSSRELAGALAAAFLADGDWGEDGLVERAGRSLGHRPRWLRRLVREVLGLHRRPPLDRPRELAALVAVLLAQRRPALPLPPVRAHALPEPRMLRSPWPVPALHGADDVGRLLGLDAGALAWLTDARSLERRAQHERLRNYRYGWLPRGGGPVRPLERPKARLKAAQRAVLHEVLDRVPAHPAAHGFTRGRSVRTHAAAHTGRRVVLRFDLEDFFATIAAGRVFGLWRTCGYPEAVAHLLTALCTNVVPAAEWAAVPRPRDLRAIAAHQRLGRRLATPHLPQGAPTSPALANLCAHRLDRRLTGLAAGFGATYTRYADDLVLSGDGPLLRGAVTVRAAVAEIVASEGWRVNPAKSQLMDAAGRQRVCGVVVNERTNVARHEYDELKAILHNAARTGPAAQNRAGVADFRAHLQGRVAWVAALHPERGARLRERLARIDWSR